MDHEKPKCIYTTFDVNSDAQGKDPDKYIPTLKDYHRKLWSKELPCGSGRFDLAPEPKAYLVHRSPNGVFFMASDAITTRLKKRAGRVIRNIPPEDLPAWPGYTIGSSIVFPGNRVDGKMAVPQDEKEYLKYLANSNSFIRARNARIDAEPCMAPS